MAMLTTAFLELQVFLAMLAQSMDSHPAILACDLLASVAQYVVLILGFLCGKNYRYFVVDLCALIAHRYIQIYL
jgi:hypothetical protein